MGLLHKLNRWYNHFYADLNGYFWLPCPICGEYFGGHEWKDGEGIMNWSTMTGKGVCKNCTEKAKKLNLESYKSFIS
jgi:hypothetical protein